MTSNRNLGGAKKWGHTVYCPLTDFDDDDFISRPVSPLLLLTVKTQARWWERTAVSSDERKLQEERKGGSKLTHVTIPERNKTEERGGRKGSEKGEREEVGRRGEKRVYVHPKLYLQFCFLDV